ncbi:two component, sigma54 specific, transcriptional regulator, Fis family [Anaeromyxobacter sp. K]|uniref:Two component, sigma54 specific, transcriptional regulator, Fis family n=1 Tax=Anaeromyxobacter dehalogenans (strain ATCC BAA-258 / DSM 21875 / 2CP-1) TaxID=455488 RepID=B8J898_ANAD2|nr:MULTISPECIES: sigma-54 dependent transcriptional regulator [Anaeromyxobacter]ACG73199.1 two component, sigma54 specific, transcriptional regulator, Fis family [Anaeromyxobacter sp. K]ACL65397.1 two component, sigma54 specific, transcriptional regulator, Fis family [Anaeromyxobacter dehalogenans 2CP-1]
MAHVLIVDDEVNIRRVLAAMLKREGYEVTTAADGEQALGVLHRTPVHVVVTDLVMPRVGGMELLRRVSQDFPDVPVILITAHGSVDSAVAALKAGAFDYITKPFEQEELKKVIAKAARAHDLERQNLHAMLNDGDGPPLIGQSPPMRAIYDMVARVADSPSTVLITGESGTGKELIAKALHRGSSRRDKPLIKVNCAAIPKDLVESELFGYERGAFTGAVGSKPGRFELADGGTLFLDEIGEVPVEMQVKLLRAIQESEFERVGGIKTLQVDVRLIAATNRDLKQLIADGRFREDLYYRLAVVPIALPPLRDRREDVPLLVRYFIEKYDQRLGKKVEGIEDEALELLANYSWPGNIRELENLMERSVLFADGPLIQASALPDALREKGAQASVPIAAVGPLGAIAAPSGASMKEIVRQAQAELERELITRALEETGGNVTRAAKRLQISRKSLQVKMKELGLRGAVDVEDDRS